MGVSSPVQAPCSCTLLSARRHDRKPMLAELPHPRHTPTHRVSLAARPQGPRLMGCRLCGVYSPAEGLAASRSQAPAHWCNPSMGPPCCIRLPSTTLLTICRMAASWRQPHPSRLPVGPVMGQQHSLLRRSLSPCCPHEQRQRRRSRPPQQPQEAALAQPLAHKGHPPNPQPPTPTPCTLHPMFPVLTWPPGPWPR